MKIQSYIKIIAIVFAAIVFAQDATAQQGMDYAGIPIRRFSRLRNESNANTSNEKALGVYTEDFYPNSLLEVNSDFAHIPFIHPNIIDRGEVFRTIAPANVIARWRFYQDADEMFQLFSPANSNDVSLQTTNNGNMFFNTATTNRVRINQTYIATTQPPIFGVTWANGLNTSGYFGIGPNGYFATNSPWSMLHLEGPNNTSYTGAGWRSWMKTGTFTKENSDAMYVGLKNEFTTNGVNRSDAVINWSDDAALYDGVDKLRFIFTSVATTGSGNNTNPIDGRSLDGYEYMRMAASTTLNGANFPVGYIGIGPVFTNALPPQSRLHINAEDALATYIQITNQNTVTGTGQTTLDGTRLGILDNGTALLYNQENRHLLFSTNTPVPANSSVLTNERMRITATGTPGTPQPTSVANNVTRVSISHDPAFPVTQPRSLLHLGYNTTGGILPTTDGWRDWMDVGMFISQGSDNVYIGMRRENDDRFDAVLSWGDNEAQSLPPNSGPDNFRIIFAASQTIGTNVGQATSNDGIEALRMTPVNHTLTTVNINTGIGGDPSINNYSGIATNPAVTLEVNSPATDPNGIIPVLPANATLGCNTPNQYWSTANQSTGFSGLRFTDLTSASTPVTSLGIQNFLTVDRRGDVILVPGIGGAGFGVQCPSANPIVDGLQTNTEVPLNNNNLIFSGNGQGSNVNNVGIGLNTALSCDPIAKLDVLQASGAMGTIGINVLNTDIPLNPLNRSIGIRSMTSQIRNISGWFQAVNNLWVALYIPQNGGKQTIGYPVGLAEGSSASPTTLLDVAGDIWCGSSITGQGVVLTNSDRQLKTDTLKYSDGLNVLRNINVFSYRYNGKAYMPTNKKHIGVFAQDIQQINEIAPFAIDTVFAKIDSTDTIDSPILAINHDALFFASLNAIKELDSIQSKFLPMISEDVPLLVSPANGAGGIPSDDITFRWHKATGGIAYFVQVSADSLFSEVNTEQQYSQNDTMFSWKSNSLSCNTKYFWRVIVLKASGSYYSNTNRFRTRILFPPVLVTPPNGATGVGVFTPINFVWRHVIGATGYKFDLASDSLFSPSATYNFITYLNDTTIVYNVPTVNTLYYWRVTAFDNRGQDTTSKIWSFTSLKPFIPAPALFNPANGDTISIGTPFSWEYVAGATSYFIFLSTTPDESGVISSYEIYPGTPVLAPVLNEKQYYWWVTACNQLYTCSEKSEIRSFYYIKPYQTEDPLLSDNIFKTDITPITGALDKVLQLNGTYFKWDLANYPELEDTALQIGLIAQEVLPVVPEVININVQGRYSVDYDRLVAVLIEAAKEQQLQITTLSNELEDLKTSVSNCCDSMSVKHAAQQNQTGDVLNIINVELINKAAILYQNMPNPFGDGTTIRYFIPDEVKNAAIVFHNEFGQELKTVEITEKGMGQINLQTANLTSGIYTYSLLIDGKLIETKRMMKVE